MTLVFFSGCNSEAVIDFASKKSESKNFLYLAKNAPVNAQIINQLTLEVGESATLYSLLDRSNGSYENVPVKWSLIGEMGLLTVASFGKIGIFSGTKIGVGSILVEDSGNTKRVLINVVAPSLPVVLMKLTDPFLGIRTSPKVSWTHANESYLTAYEVGLFKQSTGDAVVEYTNIGLINEFQFSGSSSPILNTDLEVGKVYEIRVRSLDLEGDQDSVSSISFKPKATIYDVRDEASYSNDLRLKAIHYKDPYLFVMVRDVNVSTTYKDFIKTFTVGSDGSLNLLHTYNLPAEGGSYNEYNAYVGMFLNGDYLIASFRAGLKSYLINPDGSLTLVKSTYWRTGSQRDLNSGFWNGTCMVFSGGLSGQIVRWNMTYNSPHSNTYVTYSKNIGWSYVVSSDNFNFYAKNVDTTITHYTINSSCGISEVGTIDFETTATTFLFYDDKIYTSALGRYLEIATDGSLSNLTTGVARPVYDAAELKTDFHNSYVTTSSGFTIWLSTTSSSNEMILNIE